MKTIIYSMLVLLIPLLGCNKSNQNGVKPNNIKLDPKAGNGFTFYTDNAIYAQIKSNAGSDAVRPFNIDTVTQTGNILNVTVSFSSSCPSPTFSVVWNGAILQSYPYMVDLVLSLNDTNCSDHPVQVTKTLAIDISNYIGQFALDPKTQFNILNGSKINQDLHFVSSN